MIYLFIYGTLKRNESNNTVLTFQDAEFITECATKENHTIYYGMYPELLKGGDTTVTGELWSIPKENLKAIDRFEGAPHLYERKYILIQDRPEEIWTYYYKGN